MDEIANDPAIHLAMAFLPGDMQFLHNHQILHSRNDFENWPEPERHRHLLRLWVAPPEARPLPEVFAPRYGSVVPGERGGIVVPRHHAQGPAGGGVAEARSGTLGSFDYVIVGAGTAGCVLANRLSADPDVTVLLLEAGGKDDWIWIHIPVGYLYCIGNPRTDWCYRTEPDPGLNGRSILYARGKVLGGCSSINAMLYLRGQRRDYDEWARHRRRSGLVVAERAAGLQALRGLTTAARATCTAPAASGASSGSGCRGRCSTPSARRWRRPASPKVEDFNGGDNEGAAFFEVNQRRGVRWSAAKGFLKPAMDRPNLTVMTDAHVNRLRLDGRRATGVELRRGGEDVVRRGADRDDPRGRRDRLAADPAALGHRAGRRCCRSTASRSRTICAASARTCRTTCSSAWRSR